MVSPARPCVTIGRGEQGLDFRAGQVVNLPPYELLVRHRQHPLYNGAAPWLLQRHVTEKRTNGGQPNITRTRRQASHLLGVIEEGTNQWGIKILQGHLVWRFLEPVLSEPEQLPKCFAIANDGV
jgi:hypothetical protein